MQGFQPKQTSQFSEFFRNASPEEKDRVIKRVIKEANNDQRRLMNEAVNLPAQSN